MGGADVVRRPGDRRRLDRRRRRPGQRRPRRHRGVPQRLELGRPGGQGRRQLFDQRNDGRRRAPDLGRRCDRQPGRDVPRRRSRRGHRVGRHRWLHAEPGLRSGHHRRRGLGRGARRRERRHPQRQHRPGHRAGRGGGASLLRLDRLGGQPARRRLVRKLHHLRQLERRLAGHRIQRADRGRHRRPQLRRHRRRHPLVSARRQRGELRRPGRHGLEPSRRLQQAQPLGSSGERPNRQWHLGRWHQRGQPDRRRARGAAAGSCAIAGGVAGRDARDPHGRCAAPDADARRRREQRSRGRRNGVRGVVEPDPGERQRSMGRVPHRRRSCR